MGIANLPKLPFTKDVTEGDRNDWEEVDRLVRDIIENEEPVRRDANSNVVTQQAVQQVISPPCHNEESDSDSSSSIQAYEAPSESPVNSSWGGMPSFLFINDEQSILPPGWE